MRNRTLLKREEDGKKKKKTTVKLRKCSFDIYKMSNNIQ